MARLPKYRKHPNGQAFVEHRSVPTASHRMYLGIYGSEESKAAYRRFLAEIAATPDKQIPISRVKETPIVVLIARYKTFASGYYSKDGKPSKEYGLVSNALEALDRLYGHTPASEFGPKKLLALREKLIKVGYARTGINHQVGRVKRFFAWCCQEELIAPEIYHGLTSVRGLRRGRTTAIETKPVVPVEWEVVQATIPYLSPTVTAMVLVQYYCGMRPQDVCVMRPVDLDRSRPIWIYSPPTHKNDWRGHKLVKAVPRAAQTILEPFLDRPEDHYCFSPAESRTWHIDQERAAGEEARTTPVYPSELKRRQKKRRATLKRAGTRRYQTAAYDRAITKAIGRAASGGIVIPHWSPNQLRHAIATRISAALGEQSAQRWLGHARLETTAIYSEKQLSELIEIAQALDNTLTHTPSPRSTEQSG